MFGKTMVDDDLSYRLVGVKRSGVIHCGSYVKTDQEEAITSFETGEKFYNTYDFVASINGLETGTELLDLLIYDEERGSWCSLYTMIDDTEYDSE